MTKKAIKQLILDSDYKNNRVVISWSWLDKYGVSNNASSKWNYSHNGFWYQGGVSANIDILTLKQLVDLIKTFDDGKTFELEVRND